MPASTPVLRKASALLALAALAACSTPRPYAPESETAPRAPGASAPGASSPAQAALSPKILAAQETLGTAIALQERLYRVAAPLLIKNVELCKNQARNLLGFTAKNKFSYTGEFAEAAHLRFGYGDVLQVVNVLAGSGAARAGLRKGDGLVAAEGKTLPVGARAEAQAGAVFGPLVASHATLAMTIARDGATKNLEVPVTRACAFRVELGNADNINAYADGQSILVTRGMIAFAQNDEALAYLLAKGMAHNILGHAASQRSAANLASIIDNLNDIRPDLSMLVGSAGLKPMPPELDAAADNLALYLLVRAGYQIDNAPRFWQRLASQVPASVLNSYTANHPATAYRIAAINKSVSEIKGKQAAKKPLAP